jgi:adenylylsulfate kinase
MIETRKRSLIKSVTWRVICVITSIVTAYFLTGKLDVSVAIGTIYNAITMFLYYFHERSWNKLEWGKQKI